ncbi:MAG: endospore germination permease [Oscillospiraceae bacterium]|nr:endospore germination permease [Oscillospiraceae bacterium]
MVKTKLSPRQLMILASGFSFGTTPLVLPSSMAKLAGPDVWLSILFGMATGMLFIWIYAKLGELNPDKTFVEVIKLYFGKWAGGLVVVLFIISALVLTDQAVWYMGDFIHTEFVPDFPVLPIHVLFIAVLAFALWCGVETMYRTTELLFAFLFTFIIVAILMLIPNMKPENLLPVMEKGVPPVLKGSILYIASCVLPLVFLNMVYPVCFENVKESKKALFKGYLLGAFTNLITVTVCVIVMGSNLVSNIRFPMFITSKEINIFVIFSRIEAVTFSIWMSVSFISAFSYAYAGIFGLAQLLKMKNYKILVLPIGLLLAVYSLNIYTNTSYQIKWDMTVWPLFSFTLGFILPLVLLIMSIIRKIKGKNPI